jgi:hypothetical protein
LRVGAREFGEISQIGHSPTPKLICTNLREKESAKTFVQTRCRGNFGQNRGL